MAGESSLLEKEGSGMLVTRWNEASRELPVLALKPNYLDRWPNDPKLSSSPNSNRSLSASVPLGATAQAIQESATYSLMHKSDGDTRPRRETSFLRTSCGYEATFLTTMEQRAEIAISPCKQF